ncbi:MAG: hypothetical protein KAW03_09610, partial [Candidatus Lokiarchaeota archaeon]|nr:hypothetical protein [Candidatus Lokiarchaeota archaeon]
MLFKFHDHLPSELERKYFDFKTRDYPEEKFCEDLLTQISQSYNNCKYYQENVCKKFGFTIPDELSIKDLENIPYIPTDIYKKSENRT